MRRTYTCLAYCTLCVTRYQEIGQKHVIYDICIRIIVFFFLLSIISLCTRTFSPRALGVDTYQQRGHFARDLSGIRAVCRAWQALTLKFRFWFFSAVADKKNPRGFAYFRSGSVMVTNPRKSFCFYYSR